MTRLRADLLLLLAALIWGSAFVAQKTANDAIGPMQFVSGRFFLSAILLLPFALKESRRRSIHLSTRDWMLAGAIGLCLACASIIQQIGLETTTVSNAGFITSLYIAFVPFVAWLVTRTRLRPSVLAACVVSLTGAWLLTNDGSQRRLTTGDVLVLGTAMLYALHIVLIGIFQAKNHRPYFLSLVQFGIVAVAAGALGLAFEPLTWSAIAAAMPAIVYAGALSGGIGYTLQIVAQRYTPPSEAALIMSLESVFAALSAAILLDERLTVPALIGCGMILTGVIMVEVVPTMPRRRRAA
jgi:drug/metabolite transporter (DMT)-like permease